MNVSNYSKIYQIGNRYTNSLFSSPVVIQEKIDGSQFSFANVDGKLQCRSKNNPVGMGGNAEGMFGKAYATAKAVFEGCVLPAGKLKGDVKDIGALVAEIKSDFYSENFEEVSAALTKVYYPQVLDGILGGFAQWYKAKMMENQ